MANYTYHGFTFDLEQTSNGVTIADYNTKAWLMGSLKFDDCYATEAEAIAAIHAAVDNCSWYACKEVKRGYVWFEDATGTWNSQGWGASTSSAPTAKAKIFDWDGIQNFPLSGRAVSC